MMKRAGLASGAVLAAMLAESAAAQVGGGRWQIIPDGTLTPQQLAAAATRPAVLANDASRLKPNMSFNSVVGGQRTLVFSTRPSRYALSVGADTGWETWDLRQGIRERAGQGRMGLSSLVLSPDGQCVAGLMRGADAATGAVEVWSLKTGLKLGRIGVAADANGTEGAALGFVTPERVAVFHPRDALVRIHDAATGNVTAELRTEATKLTARHVGISATGKYVGIATGGVLRLYDTGTGAVAAETDYLGADFTWKGSTDFVTFSPTGMEILVAQVATGGNGGMMRLVVVNGANGRVMAENVLPWKVEDGGRAPAFQWSSDGTGLLAEGGVYFDRNRLVMAAETVPPPPPGVLAGTRWVDGSNVVEIVGDGQSLAFAGKAAPVQAMVRGIAGGAASVPAAGVGLGVPVAFNVNGARAVTVEVGEKAPVAEPAALSEEAKIAGQIVLPAVVQPPRMTGEFGGHQIVPTRVVWGGRKSNTLFVERAFLPGGGGGLVTRGAAWVDQFNAATGQPVMAVKMAPQMELLDAAPSGKVLLFRTGAYGDRLDVGRVEGQRLVPVAGFLPFGGDGSAAVDPLSAHAGMERPTSVRWAAMVDEDHVVAYSNERQLTCFEVSTKRAVWSCVMASAEGSGKSAVPVMAPSRRYVAVGLPRGVCMVDVREGKAAMVMGTEPTKPAEPLAFAPDDGALVLMTKTEGEAAGFSQQGLRVISLTGKPAKTILLPGYAPGEGGAAGQYTDGTHLMLDDGRLVDIERGYAVWKYDLQVKPVAVNPGASQALGVFFTKKEEREPWVMVPLALPHGDVRPQAVAAANPVLFGPGSRVSLYLEVQGGPAYKMLQEEEWRKALAKIGVEVDEKAPIGISAKTWVGSMSVQYFKVEGRENGKLISRETAIDAPTISYLIKLNGEAEILWKESNPLETSVRVPKSFDLKVEQGENIGSALLRKFPELRRPAEASVIKLPPALITRNVTLNTTAITRESLLAGSGERK